MLEEGDHEVNEEDLAIIRNYFTSDEPFGPIDASEIDEPRAIDILFERHNEIYKNLHQGPSIVVGRKGSGKTSYMNSAYFANGYKYVAEVDASEAFTNVIRVVSKISSGPVFAESVAKVWDNTLHVGLFTDIRLKLPRDSKSRKLINDYLPKIGIREGDTIDDALWHVADIIAKKTKDKPLGLVADILRQLDNVTFSKTKDALIKELKNTQSKAAILLDSLDDFQLHMDSVGRALQGLLKFAGESNKPSSPIDIRLCLPAELYHRFNAISSNPNKDFRRKLLLHWVASELVFVAAHRITLYCNAHGLDKPIADKTTIQNKQDARRVLEAMLPTSLKCKLEVEEDPLAYILRHTQLLPRHLLIILNSISGKNKASSETSELLFSAESVRKGISAVEETIVHEILIAYRPVYPHAKAVCEQCIPELFMKFSIGDLERVFRTHGKKAMENDDFFDFKRMMIEIGAVGRVLDDKGRYIQAEFEYTVPHKLVTGTDDMLCFHPLFAEVFSSKIREKKPVYPYGARIEDKDYRQY